MDDLKFFMSFLEADGDPPDAAMADAASPPPDVPEDNGSTDIPDDGGNDAPPDFDGDNMGGDGDDGSASDFGDDIGEDEFMDDSSEENDSEDTKHPMELDEKISAIMNVNLYNRFLTILTNLGTQMSQIKNNSDMIYTLSPEASELFDQYKTLDDNIRLYLKNSFIDENYSKNILFFNKCLNLLKLLNDQFASYINKSIKERK